jgi:hypothetical protein
MEYMMRLKFASAVVVLGCVLMLSACDTGPAPENPSASAAIGASSVALIAATSDPCNLAPADLFWRQRGGEDGYEQRCGHTPPD